jgi:hypothetical protein
MSRPTSPARRKKRAAVKRKNLAGSAGRKTAQRLAYPLTGLILLGLAGYLATRSSPSPPPVPAAVPTAVAPVSDPELTASPTVAGPDQEFRRLIIGTWQDFHHGKRTLIVRPDGTATMIVELSGWKARLFTPRLQLEIVWSIEDGKMHRRTVGGTPADKVAIVNRRAGVAVAEPIVELTSSSMVLRDQSGSQDYHWRRVP